MVLEEPWDEDDVITFDNQLNMIMRDCLNNHLQFPMAGYSGPTIACTAGKYVLGISPEGYILGCPRIYFVSKNNKDELDKFTIGSIYADGYIYENKYNLLNDTIDELSKSYDMEKMGRTKICMAANYSKTGCLGTIPCESLGKMIRSINAYQEYYRMIGTNEGWYKKRNNRQNRKK